MIISKMNNFFFLNQYAQRVKSINESQIAVKSIVVKKKLQLLGYKNSVAYKTGKSSNLLCLFI